MWDIEGHMLRSINNKVIRRPGFFFVQVSPVSLILVFLIIRSTCDGHMCLILVIPHFLITLNVINVGQCHLPLNSTSLISCTNYTKSTPLSVLLYGVYKLLKPMELQVIILHIETYSCTCVVHNMPLGHLSRLLHLWPMSAVTHPL